VSAPDAAGGTPAAPRLPRLGALDLPARLLTTLFLLALVAGVGVGEATVMLARSGADGEPGLSLEDIRRTYHGRPGWTLLASKVDGGSMEKHCPIPSERAALLAWARGGATREGFEPARRVLDARCLRCHAPGRERERSSFASSPETGAEWERVVEFTRPDRGIPTEALARSTHAHLLGMGTLFALLGALVLMSDLPRGPRGVAAVAPLVAMLVDIGGWWLTRLHPGFAALVAAGGLLVFACSAAAAVACLRALWFPAPPGGGRPAEDPGPAPGPR
jgi:hypothetical protein